MTTAYSSLLGLALPVTGELSGTWGDMVDNGITSYLDISVAGTVTLTGDGAVTLSNTNGTSAATNIVSSLTGAGTASAQFAIIKVTGTLTTTKVITAPSTSKTYLIVNSATGGTVTLKASGQTGISVAVAETAIAYFNGTDYVKVSSTVSSTNVSSITFGSTGLTPATATTGAVTVAGTLAAVNGGTGQSSFTIGDIFYANTTTTIAKLGIGSTGQVVTVAAGVPSWATPATFSYPSAGIANSTGSAWGTSYTTTGSGTVVALATSPTIITPVVRNTVSVISTNTAAVASTTYVLTATLTLTLPASPTAGDWVKINNSSATTTPVVARNGSNIQSSATDLTIDNATASFMLTYADATRGWVITL
jgi:hypothetical protein